MTGCCCSGCCSGRRTASLIYVITYSLSCVTKHSPDFRVLMLGRVLGGIATSLLFSAFESWLVAEHFKRGFSGADARLHARCSSILACIASAQIHSMEQQLHADHFTYQRAMSFMHLTLSTPPAPFHQQSNRWATRFRGRCSWAMA